MHSFYLREGESLYRLLMTAILLRLPIVSRVL